MGLVENGVGLFERLTLVGLILGLPNLTLQVSPGSSRAGSTVPGQPLANLLLSGCRPQR